MNRNRKGAMLKITSDMYKAINKYDRRQFETFCTDLYGYEFHDCKVSVPGVDITSVMDAVKNTKGIGQKKLADIRASIEAVFGGAGKDNEGQGGYVWLKERRNQWEKRKTKKKRNFSGDTGILYGVWKE